MSQKLSNHAHGVDSFNWLAQDSPFLRIFLVLLKMDHFLPLFLYFRLFWCQKRLLYQLRHPSFVAFIATSKLQVDILFLINVQFLYGYLGQEHKTLFTLLNQHQGTYNSRFLLTSKLHNLRLQSLNSRLQSSCKINHRSC